MTWVHEPSGEEAVHSIRRFTAVLTLEILKKVLTKYFKHNKQLPLQSAKLLKDEFRTNADTSVLQGVYAYIRP